MASQQVKTSTRLWSSEVKAADKSKEQHPGYEFSNGKTKDSKKNPYA